MQSAALPNSQATLFHSCKGAMRRRRKSALTAPTVSLACRRRRILVMAIFSFSSSGARSLQSLPRTIAARRGEVNCSGASSMIQHQLALHSSHLPRSSPVKYASFLLSLKIQEMPPDRGDPDSTRGVKKWRKRATLWVTPTKFSHRCAKTAKVKTAFGVKSRRWNPYVFITSQKNSEYGGQRPQWKNKAK